MPLCSCCRNPRIEGTNSFFSRFSKSYAKKFRKKGLEKTQKFLLEGVKIGLREKDRPGESPLRDKTILDVGCGVGALHLTMLREGASRALGVDISEGMLEKARAFSSDMGLENQVEYLNADFVSLQEGPGAGKADVLLMDKVVCCYEDVEALMEKAMRQTGTVFALSHPRDRSVLKFAFRAQIFFARLFRFRFHPCWHSWPRVHGMLEQAGFKRVYSNRTFVWDVSAYRLPGA